MYPGTGSSYQFRLCALTEWNLRHKVLSDEHHETTEVGMSQIGLDKYLFELAT